MIDPLYVPNMVGHPDAGKIGELQDYGRRSPEQVAKDLTVAHDRIRTLVRNSDRQEQLILQVTRRDDRKTIMLWVQGGLLAALWALVLALIFR